MDFLYTYINGLNAGEKKVENSGHLVVGLRVQAKQHNLRNKKHADWTTFRSYQCQTKTPSSYFYSSEKSIKKQHTFKIKRQPASFSLKNTWATSSNKNSAAYRKNEIEDNQIVFEEDEGKHF